MSFFDTLEIDRRIETPVVEGEGAKRLLYMLKHAINGSAMALADKAMPEGQRWVSVSPEWIDLLGYSTDDLNADDQSMFHPDDLDMVIQHGENDLAATYGARIKPKGTGGGAGAYKLHSIDGMTVLLDGARFRCYVVEKK